MPLGVIIALVVLAVVAFVGGIFTELVNKICIFLMMIVFIVTSLILGPQFAQLVLGMKNSYYLIYLAAFIVSGALFAVPFFIPSIDRRSFSIGCLVVQETDYRAGIGFCVAGGIVGLFISGLCLLAYLNFGVLFFFILPAIIVGLICLIYSIVLIVGTVKMKKDTK